MIAVFTPSKAQGTVAAPPSKSVAHRALICAALSGGAVVRNIAFSKDIEATLGCLEAMGSKIKLHENYVEVGGIDPFNLPENLELDCIESGSTLRFFIPLVLLNGNAAKFNGSQRLMQRPLDVYKNIIENFGGSFKAEASSLTVEGKLRASEFVIPGNVSSQFITGLLFALPLTCGDSSIVIDGKLESSSYVDITIDVLRRFGIKIQKTENGFFVAGNQKYISADYTVEGDCSNAANLDAFNFIGGSVNISGVPEHTCQGDKVYRDIFSAMSRGEKNFDLSDCPDLAPILFALGAALGGDYTFSGTSRLKIKESDRAKAMADELAKFGAELKVGDNEVYIKPCKLSKPTSVLDSHNDHRIVMALALLCSVFGGEICGAEAVGKSFPQYFEIIKSIGIGLELK